MYSGLGNTAVADTNEASPVSPAPATQTGYRGLAAPGTQPAPAPAPGQSPVEKVQSFLAPQKQQTPLSLYDQVKPPVQQAPRLLDNARATIAGAVSGFQNTPTQPKNPDIIAGVSSHNAITAAHDAWTQGIDAISNHMMDVANPKVGRLDTAVAEGLVLTDTIKTGFGVLLSPFETYATVPVLGNIYDGVNKIFGAIGGAGGASAVQTLDTMPLAPETKDKLRPLVNDIGALMAQFVAGKGMDNVGEGLKGRLSSLSDKAKTITEAIHNDPVVKETLKSSESKPVNQTISDSPVADLNKAKNALANDLTKQKPGALERAKAEIQSGNMPPVRTRTLEDGSTFIEDGRHHLQAATELGMEKYPVEDVTKEYTSPQAETPVGETPTKTATDINEHLVEKGEAALTPEQMSKFEPGSYKADKEAVTKLMSTKIEDVKAMALGNKPIPREITYPQVLFNAVEAHAMETGDVKLLQDLAKSPLGTKLSEAGGTLGSHGFNDNPHSPVDLIKSVTKSREKSIEKKSGKTIDKAKSEMIAKHRTEMRQEMKASASKRPTWDDFIKEIQCGY